MKKYGLDSSASYVGDSVYCGLAIAVVVPL